MGNCCYLKSSPPTIISASGEEDLVDIEQERARQAAITFNIGKGPTKLESKFRVGFEKESFTRYKRHPPEERGSLESIYKNIPPIPLDNQPVPTRRRNSR